MITVFTLIQLQIHSPRIRNWHGKYSPKVHSPVRVDEIQMELAPRLHCSFRKGTRVEIHYLELKKKFGENYKFEFHSAICTKVNFNRDILRPKVMLEKSDWLSIYGPRLCFPPYTSREIAKALVTIILLTS